jgi:L,D-peptidoglycan transpeptidase YkuD (ErfK/YbiS/YcfS/YnhG family)
MNRLARLAAMTLLCAAVASAPGAANDMGACPEAAKSADKLVLVIGASMDARKARAQFFERGKDGRWSRVGKERPAVLGAKGLAWSWAQKPLAPAGAAIKREGDHKTPAGFFALGKPFGFSPRQGDYVRLVKGEHYCVDDPASPHYNSVVPRYEAKGATGGEDMGGIEQYREGLFIDYPTNRALQGGSCIFVHVWRGEGSATSGCVALPEADVVEMQDWSRGSKAMIGILPETAWKSLRSCFPGT